MTAEYQLSIILIMYFQVDIPGKAAADLYIPSRYRILVSSVAGVKKHT
jgi:hypothetical protein